MRVHLEAQVETVIKAALVSAGVPGITSNPATTIRTFWVDDYSDPDDAEETYPLVMIIASPSSRPTLELPQREIPVDIVIRTYEKDDLDRQDLNTIYSKVRYTLESSTLDFGAGTTNGGVTFDSPGTLDADGNIWQATIFCTYHVCAEAGEGFGA